MYFLLTVRYFISKGRFEHIATKLNKIMLFVRWQSWFYSRCSNTSTISLLFAYMQLDHGGLYKVGDKHV